VNVFIVVVNNKAADISPASLNGIYEYACQFFFLAINLI
jgi:hypothetical protein